MTRNKGGVFGVLLVTALAGVGSGAEGEGVTVKEEAGSFVLSNGVVTATVSKRSGDLMSMTFKGTETLTDKSGHAGAYWSHDASGGVETQTKITIDPAKVNGERGEVSVKGISGGKKMGHPAGGAADGDFPADIEIRYALGKGDQGVYTYCILTHKPEYPAGSIGESRFCAKLASMYDWLSVDAHRNKYYPREEPGEDKYVYTAVQSENLAYGWSSTTKKAGWWLVNPTIEYLSGGPTKVEFLCHRDTTAVQAPCVLNYWRSSHYGGAVVSVAAGEKWEKVIGPFLLYANEGETPEAMWTDARAQAGKEGAKWPYAWVEGGGYGHKEERSVVKGKFVLKDAQMPGGFSGKITAGLTGASWESTSVGRGGQPVKRTITWQTDAKNYQYWSRNEGGKGRFEIAHVQPGDYTLYAYADGVLGEFAKAAIHVPEGGKEVDLGEVEWAPVRKGKQVWEIGIPNRTATEFAGGDAYFDPETQIKYAKLFPEDVTFVVGKSDIAKDWYFEHIPHNVDPEAKVVPFSGIRSTPGKATPYRIRFEMAEAPKGKATLRLALCTGSVPSLAVAVNGQAAGTVDRLNVNGDATIVRHNIQGIWFERELGFDAGMLKKGENEIVLTVPEGSLNSGVIYDCVRLEVAE